ncbi:MAG: hypothetical protein Q8T09_08815 [Candidatus Melainabacteria bacterium]|nr:hypothetical protein [Candidatus Melainabacteria bacterium]
MIDQTMVTLCATTNGLELFRPKVYDNPQTPVGLGQIAPAWSNKAAKEIIYLKFDFK